MHLRILLADDLQRSVFADGAENPFGVKRRRQIPRPFVVVSHRDVRQLDRIIGWDEHQHILIQAMTDMRVARVTLTVANGDRCARSPGSGVGVHTSPVSSSRR